MYLKFVSSTHTHTHTHIHTRTYSADFWFSDQYNKLLCFSFGKTYINPQGLTNKLCYLLILLTKHWKNGWKPLQFVETWGCF